MTGSSYLSILIPGELLAPAYRRQQLAAKNLARIVVESGGIIVPLVPWSMAGVYITGTIGVPTLEYLPWAFMNYLSVLRADPLRRNRLHDGAEDPRRRDADRQLTDGAPLRSRSSVRGTEVGAGTCAGRFKEPHSVAAVRGNF